MNFFGMGTMEVLVILLLAFIFLGPERMVEAARLLGKLVREARRMTAELPGLVIDEDQPASAKGRGAQQHDAPGGAAELPPSGGDPAETPSPSAPRPGQEAHAREDAGSKPDQGQP